MNLSEDSWSWSSEKRLVKKMMIKENEIKVFVSSGARKCYEYTMLLILTPLASSSSSAILGLTRCKASVRPEMGSVVLFNKDGVAISIPVGRPGGVHRCPALHLRLPCC